jgi:hypothetical protein
VPVYQVLRTISRNERVLVNANSAAEAREKADDVPDDEWIEIDEDCSVEIFSVVEDFADGSCQDLARDPSTSVRN